MVERVSKVRRAHFLKEIFPVSFPLTQRRPSLPYQRSGRASQALAPAPSSLGVALSNSQGSFNPLLWVGCLAQHSERGGGRGQGMSLEVHSGLKSNSLMTRTTTFSSFVLYKAEEITTVTLGSVCHKALPENSGTKGSGSQNNTSKAAWHGPDLCLISQQTFWLGSPITIFKCHELYSARWFTGKGTCCQA